VIDIQGVTKTFTTKRRSSLLGGKKRVKKTVALDNLNLTVEHGEVHGLVGANGSGKSTLMQVIAGLLIPTSGQVLIGGHKNNPFRKAKVRVGYLPASGRLYPHLTVRENIALFAALAGIPKKDIPKAVSEAIHELGCEGMQYEYPEDLSFGMHQKARLARLMVIQPQALLLDEPSTGVDIVASAQFNQMIRYLSDRGIPILLATHDPRELESYCSRITVLNQGQSVFTGTLAEMRQSSGTDDTADAIYQYIKQGQK
jgi:ABC-type multidrug transport system ATPase subunit